MAFYCDNTLTLTGEAQPAVLRAVTASADLFPLLGARPLLGRMFLAEEDKPGNLVAMLSNDAHGRNTSTPIRILPAGR